MESCQVRRLCLWLCLVWVGPALAADPALDGPRYDRAQMQLELERLASICDRLQLTAEAELCRKWLPIARADQLVLYLPSAFPAADDARPVQASWCQHFREARQRYARWLFAQAQQSVQAGDELQAFRQLWHVLREDPEHAEARRVLGPLADAAMVRPRVRGSAGIQPDFQWPADSYRRIQTPHFLLTTRADTKESLAIAQQLETTHALWSQLFFDMWAPRGLLSERFDGAASSWNEPRKMQVFLLKDRDDYLATLGVSEQNIGVSVGYYSLEAKQSFFYPTDNLAATFVHELTHQLFAEASHVAALPQAGSQGGIWLLEGIALYMESLKGHQDYWTVGGVDAPRLQTARYRAVRDGYWPDWNAFAHGTIEAWKADANLALYYSHAAGLTHVMLDLLPEKESARGALLAALQAAYEGRAQPGDELLQLLGASEAEAKQRYQDLQIISDAQLQAVIASNPSLAELVLAGSHLEASSWQRLAALQDLTWLDVSFSNATTTDLNWIDASLSLERLSVEGTSVSGDLLQHVAKLPRLEELDVSGCPINDQAVSALRGSTTIHTLWLTQTRVTNQCLETLTTMPQLRMVDVAGTAIEPPVWEAFRRSRGLR